MSEGNNDELYADGKGPVGRIFEAMKAIVGGDVPLAELNALRPGEHEAVVKELFIRPNNTVERK